MIEGSYALGILNEDEPDTLIGARNESPLVVGLSDGEFFIASDVPALISHTRDFIFLDDGEVVQYRDNAITITDLNGDVKEKSPRRIDWSPVMAEKGGYKHFMLKEIFEQPQGIIDTIRGRISEERGEVILPEIGLSNDQIKDIEKIMIVACGTSWHAGLVGKFIMEQMLRIPTDIELGSEFRYRDPIVGQKTLLVSITQSGETTDTLAAMREAREKGCYLMTICNAVESLSLIHI